MSQGNGKSGMAWELPELENPMVRLRDGTWFSTDPAKARAIARTSRGKPGDPDFYEETLYRRRRDGRAFLVGRGDVASPWGVTLHDGETRAPAKGLRVMEDLEAEAWVRAVAAGVVG